MSESETTRNTDELADFTDARLVDVLHESGLLEDDDDTPYSREDALVFARAAYWQGVEDSIKDPSLVSQAALNHVAGSTKDDQEGLQE